MGNYDIFGHKFKEPPQVTMARSILSVGRNASEDEIKREYRKLMMK